MLHGEESKPVSSIVNGFHRPGDFQPNLGVDIGQVE